MERSHADASASIRPIASTSYAEASRLDPSRPEIRLLRMLPNDGTRAPSCEIRVARLPADYSALSYCWGPPEPIQNIKVQVGRHEYSLTVRQNLYDFLAYSAAVVAHASKTRWLWIDAICIDQSNTIERNHQVQQMGRVYREAKEVVVWLGNDEKLAVLLCNTYDIIQTASHASANADGQLKKFLIDYKMHLILERLLRHVYWTRLWIIQEILLPHIEVMRVACADSMMPWISFAHCFHALSGCIARTGMKHDKRWSYLDKEQPQWTMMRDMLELRGGATYGEPVLSVEALLNRSATAGCGEKLDKVYGLISLLDRGDTFRVDYALNRFELYFKAWSHFELYEIRLGTILLAKVLDVDFQSLLAMDNEDGRSCAQKIRVKNVMLQPLQPETLGATHVPPQAFSGDVLCLPCQMCNADIRCFVPTRTKVTDYAFWCTNLGLDAQFHVLFVLDRCSVDTMNTSRWKSHTIYELHNSQHVEIKSPGEDFAFEVQGSFSNFDAIVSLDQQTLIRFIVRCTAPTVSSEKAISISTENPSRIHKLSSLMSRMKFPRKQARV